MKRQLPTLIQKQRHDINAANNPCTSRNARSANKKQQLIWFLCSNSPDFASQFSDPPYNSHVHIHIIFMSTKIQIHIYVPLPISTSLIDIHLCPWPYLYLLLYLCPCLCLRSTSVLNYIYKLYIYIYLSMFMSIYHSASIVYTPLVFPQKFNLCFRQQQPCGEQQPAVKTRPCRKIKLLDWPTKTKVVWLGYGWFIIFEALSN